MIECGLKYFVTLRRTYAVVFFSGGLDEFSQSVLEKVGRELAELQFPFYVLDLHGVKSFDQQGLSALGAVTQFLRSRPAALRVCLNHGDLKEALIRFGVVTGDEFRFDLEETLRSLSFKPASHLIKPEIKKAV